MYTCKDIKKNEQFTIENIIPKRPGIGITPINAYKIYGKKASKNISNDTRLKWSMIK